MEGFFEEEQYAMFLLVQQVLAPFGQKDLRTGKIVSVLTVKV